MIITAEFISDIHFTVKKHGVSYIDAIIDCCERRNIEVEVAASLIKTNPKIKAMVQEEAEKLNFLEKTVRLDL